MLGQTVCCTRQGPDEAVLRHIGVLFQSGALFSSLTVAENVAFPLRQFTNLPQEVVCSLVAFKLGLVGLAGYEQAMPRN